VRTGKLVGAATKTATEDARHAHERPFDKNFIILACRCSPQLTGFDVGNRRPPLTNYETPRINIPTLFYARRFDSNFLPAQN